MLKSMTGFGEASAADERLRVAVEIRSVNNRYLKINSKLPESHARLEPEVERMVRQKLSRGTVTISVRLAHVDAVSSYQLNEPVIRGYLDQLRAFDAHPERLLGEILALPGSVRDALGEGEVERDWSLVEQGIESAIASLEEMRRREGRAMHVELSGHCQAILELVDGIATKSGAATVAYRDRLAGRVQELLSSHGVTVSSADLIREVSIFADRTDIAEEMARLRSHVEQFVRLMDGPEACGRKLDFLGQEMFRECNTMGAKSGDPRVSSDVVELKSVVERIREMIANVE